MIKVFATRNLMQRSDEIVRLKSDFKDYKEGFRLPNYFGRDGDFTRHQNATSSNLRHLHLAESKNFWKPFLRQYDRTSNYWLIYCSGFWNVNNYLLIAILKPDAHQQARQNRLLDGLSAVAERFRNQY